MRGVCEVVVAEAQSVGGVNQHRVLGMDVGGYGRSVGLITSAIPIKMV